MRPYGDFRNLSISLESGARVRLPFLLVLTFAAVWAYPARLVAVRQAPVADESPVSQNTSAPKTAAPVAPTAPTADRGARRDRRDTADPKPQAAALDQSQEVELRSLLAAATAASGKLNDSERTQLQEIAQKLSQVTADVPALLRQASIVFEGATQREFAKSPPETRPSEPSGVNLSLEKSSSGRSAFATSLLVSERSNAATPERLKSGHGR